MPINPSDNVHETVFKPGDRKKPNANANDGRHQKRNIFVPLHNTSRCRGSRALGISLIVAKVWPNEKEISHGRGAVASTLKLPRNGAVGSSIRWHEGSG
jgi:hypothetical protein